MRTNVKCDYRQCLDNSRGYCTATQIDIVHGRCASMLQSRQSMRSDVKPMVRNARGALANKQR